MGELERPPPCHGGECGGGSRWPGNDIKPKLKKEKN